MVVHWEFTSQNGGINRKIHILGISSSQLTNSIIFQRGRLNHQPHGDFMCFFNGKTGDLLKFSMVMWDGMVVIIGFGDHD